MKVKSQSEAAQLCLTLSDPMDFSLPGSSHGIFQAKVHRTLINIWVAKAILVGSQNEMRNMLLNSGEKVILVINWQKNLAEVYSNVLRKVNLSSCETG